MTQPTTNFPTTEDEAKAAAEGSPRPITDPATLDLLETFLRNLARPERTRGYQFGEIYVRSAEFLLAMGATCDPEHIGPFLKPPGEAEEWKCLACQWPRDEAEPGGGTQP